MQRIEKSSYGPKRDAAQDFTKVFQLADENHEPFGLNASIDEIVKKAVTRKNELRESALIKLVAEHGITKETHSLLISENLYCGDFICLVPHGELEGTVLAIKGREWLAKRYPHAYLPPVLKKPDYEPLDSWNMNDLH